MKFKVGNVVRLKSGGPLLVVRNVRPELNFPYTCVGFTDLAFVICENLVEEILDLVYDKT